MRDIHLHTQKSTLIIYKRIHHTTQVRPLEQYPNEVDDMARYMRDTHLQTQTHLHTHTNALHTNATHTGAPPGAVP